MKGLELGKRPWGNRALWYPKGWGHSLSRLERSVRKSGKSQDPETLKYLVSVQGTKGFSIPSLHRETESFASPSWNIFFRSLPGSPHSGELIGSRCTEKERLVPTNSYTAGSKPIPFPDQSHIQIPTFYLSGGEKEGGEAYKVDPPQDSSWISHSSLCLSSHCPTEVQRETSWDDEKQNLN